MSFCHQHSAVAHDRYVYICGGFNKEKQVLNSMLRYEPLMDKWLKVAPVKYPRVRHGQ